MTIWLLAVLLLAALAGLGLRQGAIRVLLSFFGIVIGGLLAGPLGHLFRPLLSAFGVKHPMYLAVLPPCIGFLIILTIFKIAGAVLNKKVETHFKYKSGELQLAMWERLNHRLGMALGFFNGAAYLVLVSVAAYLLSYWTFQMASGDNDPRGVRVLNDLGQDLQKTGMYRVVGAVNRAPQTYFQAGDIVGLIYHNPLLQARLSRYPAIIGLSEQPEFQDLGNDKDFTELQMRQPPIIDLLNYPKVQAIIQNPETVKTITNALLPNLSDLQTFLETGKSQTFTEDIFGRWDFDLPATMSLVRKGHPNMSAAEARKYRNAFAASFTKLTFVAAPGGMAKLKSFPHINRGNPPTIELQDAQGQWSGTGGSYSVSVPIEGKDQQLKGEIHGDRLALSGPDLNLGFVRED
ncbi:MAG TPA: CvpA family protein [Verrucomicrobiae bacterium]|nr:CvpA family protein [Verrucomicrobiae bacterium]